MCSRMELAKDEPLGLIAGRGDLPRLFCRAARAAGSQYLGVVAVRPDAAPTIAELADQVDWVYPGQLNRLIRAFQRQSIRYVFCAGQIKPTRLFTGLRPDLRALRLLRRLRERNAETIFGAVADELAKSGLQVLPVTVFMADSLAREGVLGQVRPRRSQAADIEFGLRIARETSRLDIGQTVVVKRGTVLAVEAFEGTDRAIRRGAELGRGGVTVVKVAKPGHDMRFDIPCVGLGTVASLRAAKAKVLAVQAQRTLLLDEQAVIHACDEAGIALVGVASVSPPGA